MLMKRMQTDRSLAYLHMVELLQPQWLLPCFPHEREEELWSLPGSLGPLSTPWGICRAAKGTQAPELFRCFGKMCPLFLRESAGGSQCCCSSTHPRGHLDAAGSARSFSHFSHLPVDQKITLALLQPAALPGQGFPALP